MTTPFEDAELAELVRRCKRLIAPHIQPREDAPDHGCWITEIEEGGVRVVLEVPVDPEKSAMFDICLGTTLVYREHYSIPRPDRIADLLRSLRYHMVLDDLADV